ncbi:MAG: Do family serine endopeptidase [Planctomycetota bacterium]|nr:MAG: Do family serine endopeptidase [Planctomycetota bacterium]
MSHFINTGIARIAHRTTLASVLLACAPLCALAAAPQNVVATSTAANTQANNSAKSEARSLSHAFRGAAKRLSASVVTINTTSNGRAQQQQQQGPARGTGTGAVISKDGYIVTANHVVADADEIELVFEDGRTASATVVGLDPGTDIAVLHTDATNLTPATFGDSAVLDVGDWVVAIGAPFGLQQTVTAGIVSAKGRSDVGLATFENYIQTDAAINPGNSGGPLANLDGEIIGINSCISSRGGGNDGIGFAVPSAVAQRVVNDIIADGRVSRGWLGIGVQPVDDDMIASLGCDSASGVLVNSVARGSPAEAAGILAGDLITTIAGKKVRTPGELIAVIGEREPGAIITLHAVRDGESQSIDATLGERDDAKQARGMKKSPEMKQQLSAIDKLGFTLKELTAEEVTQLSPMADDGALVVERVAPEGPAALAGIEPGDLIRRIGSRATHTLDEATAAIDALREGSSMPVLVEREGRAQFILVRPMAEAPANRSRSRN